MGRTENGQRLSQVVPEIVGDSDRTRPSVYPAKWRLVRDQSDLITVVLCLITSYCALVYACTGLGLIPQYDVYNRYNVPPQRLIGEPAQWDEFVQLPDEDLQRFFKDSLNQDKNPLEWWAAYKNLTSHYEEIMQPMPLPEGMCRIMIGQKWDFVNGVCNVNATHGRGLSYVIVANAEKMQNANNEGKYVAMVTGIKKTILPNGDWNMISAILAGCPDPAAISFMKSWDPKQVTGSVDLVQVWGGDGLEIRLCSLDPPRETICRVAKNYYDLNNFPFDPRTVPVLRTTSRGELIAVPYMGDSAMYDRVVARMYYTDYAQLSGMRGGFSIGHLLTIDVRPVVGGTGSLIPLIQVLCLCVLVLWAESGTKGASNGIGQPRISLLYVFGQLATAAVVMLQMWYFTYYEVFYMAINLHTFGMEGTMRVPHVCFAQVLSVTVLYQVATPVLRRIGSDQSAVTRHGWIHLGSFLYSIGIPLFLLAIAPYMGVIDARGLYLQNADECMSRSHTCGYRVHSFIHYMVPGYIVLVLIVARVAAMRRPMFKVVKGSESMLAKLATAHDGHSCRMVKELPPLFIPREMTAFESFCLGTSTWSLVRNIEVHKLEINDKVYVAPSVAYACGFLMIKELGLVRVKDFYLVGIARYCPELFLHRLNLSLQFFPVVGNNVYPGHRVMLYALHRKRLNLQVMPMPLLS